MDFENLEFGFRFRFGSLDFGFISDLWISVSFRIFWISRVGTGRFRSFEDLHWQHNNKELDSGNNRFIFGAQG